jgi:hypothetical protein
MCRLAIALTFAWAASARAQSSLDLIDEATRAGLPRDVLVDKLREGVAKGIPPAQIVRVVRGLAQSLAQARREAQPFVGATPSPELVKAIVAAHAAGIATEGTLTVLRAGGREQALVVLTQLVQYGCPALLVARSLSVLNGDWRSIEQLERLRRIDGLSLRDALEALAGANERGVGIDHAEPLFRGSDISDDNGRGPERETSGARGPRSGGVGVPAPGKGHS